MAGDDDKPRSAGPRGKELEGLAEDLGSLATGLAGKLFGKALDPERSPDTPVVSPEVDRNLEELGAVVGRWLRAAGEGLKAHPDDPEKAVDHMASKLHDDDPVPDEGEWSPLVTGAQRFTEGLGVLAGELLGALSEPASGGSEE